MYLSYVYTLLDEAHSFGGALVVQAKDIHAYSCTSISLMERSKLYYPQLPLAKQAMLPMYICVVNAHTFYNPIGVIHFPVPFVKAWQRGLDVSFSPQNVWPTRLLMN